MSLGIILALVAIGLPVAILAEGLREIYFAGKEHDEERDL